MVQPAGFALGFPLRQTVAAQLATLQSGSMQFIMNQVAGTPQAKILWERGFFTVGSTRVLQLSLSLPEGTKLYAKFHTQSDGEQPCTEAEVYDGYMLLLPHEELTYYTNSPVGCEFMAELYAIYPGVCLAPVKQHPPAVAVGCRPVTALTVSAEDPVREELLGYAEYRIQGTERGSPKGMHLFDLQVG